MDEVERENLTRIRRLNQRGGRMLSIVDLLGDGSVDSYLAGYLTYCMSRGWSFLTSAGPSGTGKTTLMGSMLNLLPVGMEIETVENPESIDPDSNGSTCYLVHEINNAPYYGYLWGLDARKFFLRAHNNCLAASLHADTLSEIEDKLLSPPVDLPPDFLAEIDLMLFMTRERSSGGTKRRVSKVYGSNGSEHILLFEWRRGSDTFRDIDGLSFLRDRVGDSEASPVNEDGIRRIGELYLRMLENNINRLAEVRQALLDHSDWY